MSVIPHLLWNLETRGTHNTSLVFKGFLDYARNDKTSSISSTLTHPFLEASMIAKAIFFLFGAGGIMLLITQLISAIFPASAPQKEQIENLQTEGREQIETITEKGDAILGNIGEKIEQIDHTLQNLPSFIPAPMVDMLRGYTAKGQKTGSILQDAIKQLAKVKDDPLLNTPKDAKNPETASENGQSSASEEILDVEIVEETNLQESLPTISIITPNGVIARKIVPPAPMIWRES